MDIDYATIIVRGDDDRATFRSTFVVIDHDKPEADKDGVLGYFTTFAAAERFCDSYMRKP